MPAATLLLPARARCGAAALPDALARVLGRADRSPPATPGERAQLLRHFDLLPRGWPVAALTRQLDADDAAGATWLRADPAWVRPDINGARLLGCGDALRLEPADVAALLPALRPLFGDAGFPLDAPVPSRWYLRLPAEAKLPTFAEPADALGADLFEHLPEGDEGRRWRALLSEVQVVLHNHPWNARRLADGKPAVNSLWFWGGGRLPDRVATPHAQVRSADVVLQALGRAAGARTGAGEGDAAGSGDVLFDLRTAADPLAAAVQWMAALQDGGLRELALDFADGAAFVLRPNQRWRLWRRPLRRLDA